MGSSAGRSLWLAFLLMAGCATGGSSSGGGYTEDGVASGSCVGAATQPCFSGAAATEGVGECRSGSQTCSEGTWGACAGQVLPVSEICDGKDNNCNGLVDEGCSCANGQSRDCYTGPPASEGVGACAPGQQQCVDQVWGDVCSGEMTPMPQMCAGIDNNCNGVVDEGCSCSMGASESCYTGPSATEGVGQCKAGAQQCGSMGWGGCNGSVTPISEICNGLDDNCNGVVDDEPAANQWCAKQKGGGYVCTGGTCACLPSNMCGGQCVDLTTNADDCGACGTKCATGGSCANSACVCPAGETACTGVCVDMSTDSASCGSCGHVCSGGETCQNGSCVCPGGDTFCGGSCVDTATDDSNCGSCGKACTGGETCKSGACACPAGDTLCSGTCVDTSTNGNDCGSCGHVCTGGEGCQAGTCGCTGGTTVCSGTCVDTATDPSNCGSCGTTCPVGGSCSGSACACPGGDITCSGTCVNPGSDSSNCGTCGHVCTGGESCQGGGCVCPGGDTFCSGTCVNTGSDSSNCGGCGITCAVGGSCSGGGCVCPGGETDCSGTCIDTSSNPSNCGTCGNSCPSGVCSGGTCTSTCPFVYAYDGKGFAYETTVGGASLVGGPSEAALGREMRFAPMWARLDHTAVDRRDGVGRARAKLLIAEDEIAYVDELHLTAVEHPKGYEVLTSSSLQWTTIGRDDPQEWYVLRTAALRGPVHATWRDNVDVTRAIGTLDDRAVAEDPAVDNFYDLDFGAIRDPRHTRLVVDGWKYKMQRGLPPNVPRQPPRLEIQGADGTWTTALRLAQPRGDRKAVVFDLAAVDWPQGKYRMRLYTGTNEEGLAMWLLDRVRLTEEPSAPVHVVDIPAASARLSFFGAPTLVDGDDYAHPRWNHDDGKGILPEVGTWGAFTRYGDVRSLTAAADDELVVMRQGDGIELTFEGVPRAPAGREVTLLLRTELLFKPRICVGCTEPTATSESVFPLPFHGMTRYPYGPEENYPSDDAHRLSLERYDTRDYSRGERRWGP